MTANNKAAALTRAIALLKKREYCAAQLRQKLQAHHPPEEVAAAISELQRCNLLSDTRFARVYVRGRNKQGGQWGKPHIAQSLARYGISEEDAAAAMESELNKDEPARAAEALKKKYSAPPKDAKTLASMARFLSARGFDEETIKAALPDSSQLTDDS